MNMTEQRLKHDKTAAIGQLCNMKPGESIIYNIGETPGPHGRSIYWLANRGGLALVQRVDEPCHGDMHMQRTFTYIAQRTAKAMPKEDVRRAFSPKEW
jgi:hypothetical protein